MSEDGDGAEGDGENHDAKGAKTVPSVDLGLYQLSVSVSGRDTDGVEDVEDAAKRLMNYLVEHAKELENGPDDRGLG